MRFTRVTLFFIAFIITLGFYQLTSHFLAGVEPQIFQATEEMMVDNANILAELVEAEMRDGEFDSRTLRETFDGAHRRKFHAAIYDFTKTTVGTHAYVTDARGIVIFDTDAGKRVGRDYSAMNDVRLTLAGKYGARSSRTDEGDSATSVFYVAAPIGDPANPAGVLTLYKPQLDVLPLVRERKRIIYTACALIGSGIIFLIGAVFLWLFRPIGNITEYARAIERGERPAKPKLGIGREVNTLARALDSMRDAIEGRQYAERYVQTLTHEMKSPLAAIRGAAELLDEDLPPKDRERFLQNILAETARTERLINRLLELSAIESRARLESTEPLDFRDILARAIDQAKPLADVANVPLHATTPDTPLTLRGDPFILRAAVTNLLENAIDFSPAAEPVEITLSQTGGTITLTIRDHGPGIPDYAREKIFDRFFSLRHHKAGRKGTGLGLTLVRETAELHNGTITLAPAPGGGTTATLTLPASQP